MPLVREIENTLPVLAEMPEQHQQYVAHWLSNFCTNYEDAQSMPPHVLAANMQQRSEELQRRAARMRRIISRR
jgi:hypothetical protein